MDADLRTAYNRAFSQARYERYLSRLAERVGQPSFRVAETPLFVPVDLRDQIFTATRQILAQLSEPSRLSSMRSAIPRELDAPGMDALPNCVQVDFAITRRADGGLAGRVVELQGFPSLYAFTMLQAKVWNEELASIAGIDGPLEPYFGDFDFEKARGALIRTIVAGEDPETVVLIDLAPDSQKTLPDFVATKQLVGIDSVCVTDLVRDGKKLYRKKDGRLVPVRRLFNRVVFDELAAKRPSLPFAYTDELDVTWCSHPNWYWVWSKYSLPKLDHPAIPEARLLSELQTIPSDLENFVLKPLFSFAGSGVKVDVTRADLDKIADSERGAWMLQRKIEYARDLRMPEGEGVAAELRVMCLRAPGEPAPQPVLNLVRLSRGKMLGVDHNRNLTWVGSSVGLSPRTASANERLL